MIEVEREGCSLSRYYVESERENSFPFLFDSCSWGCRRFVYVSYVLDLYVTLSFTFDPLCPFPAVNNKLLKSALFPSFSTSAQTSRVEDCCSFLVLVMSFSLHGLPSSSFPSLILCPFTPWNTFSLSCQFPFLHPLHPRSLTVSLNMWLLCSFVILVSVSSIPFVSLTSCILISTIFFSYVLYIVTSILLFLSHLIVGFPSLSFALFLLLSLSRLPLKSHPQFIHWFHSFYSSHDFHYQTFLYPSFLSVVWGKWRASSFCTWSSSIHSSHFLALLPSLKHNSKVVREGVTSKRVFNTIFSEPKQPLSKIWNAMNLKIKCIVVTRLSHSRFKTTLPILAHKEHIFLSYIL